MRIQPYLNRLDQSSNEGYAGVALDLIESLLGSWRPPYGLEYSEWNIHTGNGQGDVVEIPCRVSKDRIEPMEVGIIPDHCLGLMKTIKTYEQLTIQAAIERSYNMALQALTIHPLVQDHQSGKKSIGRIFIQHGEYIPGLS